MEEFDSDFKKDFAEKTVSEIVHDSGVGRHAFKKSELGLLWSIIRNKHILIMGDWGVIHKEEGHPKVDNHYCMDFYSIFS